MTQKTIKKLYAKAKEFAILSYFRNGIEDFNRICITEDGNFEVEFCYFDMLLGYVKSEYILLSQKDMNGSIEDFLIRQHKILEEQNKILKEQNKILEEKFGKTIV